MKYEQLLIKTFHYIRQRPALVVVTILMATAPWLQTTLQGTVDWTGKGYIHSMEYITQSIFFNLYWHNNHFVDGIPVDTQISTATTNSLIEF